MFASLRSDTRACFLRSAAFFCLECVIILFAHRKPRRREKWNKFIADTMACYRGTI